MTTAAIDRHPWGYPKDKDILRLWREGKNTNEIAKATWSRECEISNRLPLILQRAKQDQEWNYDRTA